MNVNTFNKEDFWRAVILYGLNQSTYKIALGQCLINFSRQERTQISINELAQEFFNLYLIRLEGNKPQLSTPNRRTVMETIIDNYNLGKISETEAIERVERQAFGDVVPRFHTVNNIAIPVKFYEYEENNKLIINDNLFETFENLETRDFLSNELGSRWDLLEASFEIKRENSLLENDIRRIYLAKGHERRDITYTRPVLNGYQNGVCFYCGEKMVETDIHVDHVIPRQLVYNDEIWNLVLSHTFCNSQKNDSLPSMNYIEKLILRNEHFIISNHPIKNKLIEQLGKTPQNRRNYILKVYEDAKIVIRYTWEGIRGYNPATDSFYKTFIRSISK